MKQEFNNIVDTLCERDQRYHPHSYEFVMEALAYAQKKFQRQRHVSGLELLESMKNLILEKFGPMALAVLKHWGIKSTEDFGHIVFNLVENKVLSKAEEDSFEDFMRGWDFEEIFRKDYRRQLEKQVSRLR